jgi:hypothetical protein
LLALQVNRVAGARAWKHGAGPSLILYVGLLDFRRAPLTLRNALIQLGSVLLYGGRTLLEIRNATV